MPRNHLLYILAILVCTVAGLHFLASAYYLYWTLWWYDVIMHFLGGVFAGLLALWLRFFSGYFGTPRIPPWTRLLVFTVLSVLAIGIGWEIFERSLGATFSVEGYSLDTSLDILFDFLGSFVAFGFFITRYVLHGQGK